MTKRLLDIFVASLAMLSLSPVMLLTAIAVSLRLGRPVLFRQKRPGLDGIPFELIKFRTMTNACDKNGNLLPDADRQNPLGRFLRATSLDELPGLWSVLKGDMSLVGPRPLLVAYLALYTPEQYRRHSVKPGITGLAQVSGRNAISWEEKFQFDLDYVDNHSLGLDFKILLRTFFKVIRREGINKQGFETTDRFEGSGEKMSHIIKEDM
jgi:sugar transferase EpsL